MARKHIYSFGGAKADGSAAMKELLGGKGAALCAVSSIGIPVPPGHDIVPEVRVTCDEEALGLHRDAGRDARAPRSRAAPPSGDRAQTGTFRTSSSLSRRGRSGCSRLEQALAPASPPAGEGPPTVPVPPARPRPLRHGGHGLRFRIGAAVTAALVLGVGMAAALYVVLQPARFPAPVVTGAAAVLFGNAVMMARAIRNLLLFGSRQPRKRGCCRVGAALSGLSRT